MCTELCVVCLILPYVASFVRVVWCMCVRALWLSLVVSLIHVCCWALWGLFSTICVGLPFLAKCSCTTVLSFMSVCVLGCALKLSINLLIPAHAPIISPLVFHVWYTFFYLQIVYFPFYTLCPLYTVFLIIAEPKPHTKIWITCAGKYFNLLSMHAYHVKHNQQFRCGQQTVHQKWMGKCM